MTVHRALLPWHRALVAALLQIGRLFHRETNWCRGVEEMVPLATPSHR